MTFEKHKTSCKYLIDGFAYAFTGINFERGLIYLDVGGINQLPVRLSDVEKVQVMGLGELNKENKQWVMW